MEFRLIYNNDNGILEQCDLSPQVNENADTLCGYAQALPVLNPCTTFNKIVKSGSVDSMNDSDYANCIRKMKFIGENIFENKAYQNVFAVCARLMKALLNTLPEHLDDTIDEYRKNNSLIPVEFFLDANNIHGEQRGSFYGFVSLKLIKYRKPEHVISFEPEGSPMIYKVPVNNQVFYVLRNDCKAKICVSYDPLYGWLWQSGERERLADSDIDFLCDSEEFMDISDMQMRDLKDTIILQCKNTPVDDMFDILKDQDEIELWEFKSDENAEGLESLGTIKADSVIHKDGIDFIVFKRVHDEVDDDFPFV